MRLFLCFDETQRDSATALASHLGQEGQLVWGDPAGYPAGRSEIERLQRAVAGADLFLFLVSAKSIAKGSAALSALTMVGERWSVPEGRVLAVMIEEVVPAALPPYLQRVERMPADPVIVSAAVCRLGTHLAHMSKRRHLLQGLGLAGTLMVVFLIILVGLRLAGPPVVDPTAGATPQFHLQPPNGSAEWLGQARFELVNTLEAPDLEYYCKVVYPQDSPSVAGIKYDRQCREIVVYAGMGPFVDGNGRATRIGYYDPERSDIEVRVFDETDTLIWQAPLLFGAMNGFRGFEVLGLPEVETPNPMKILWPTYVVKFGEVQDFEVRFKGNPLPAGFVIKARTMIPNQMMDLNFRQGSAPGKILFQPKHSDIAKRFQMGNRTQSFQAQIILDIMHKSGYKAIHQFFLKVENP